MSVSIPVSSQHKKPFQRKNGSDELDVFEAARYFSGGTENSSATHKTSSGGARNFNYNTRPFGRMSLDMPNHRDNNPIPLQAMLMENRMMINKEKKSKQPSSPGGKLAHFLNSLFNQTSSKKSKSKTKSTKDEDQSHGGWRRKRRSSMSNFTSRTTTTTTTSTTTATTNDSKSSFSTSISSGFRTPPPYHVSNTPTKTKPYSYLKPSPTQITKIPITGNLNKIETFTLINNLADKKINFHNEYLEKVRTYDEKQEDVKEYKRFLDDVDDGGDSDSISDLFELTNCDLGYCSSGSPVYETTCMDISIKRGAPISS
ncbi:protein BIG GRAIN 1-like E [Bidens hawaiensis]|uniref:protein BIG GRAIN 1-like E n=1 Tax=Bidens hawaiensis TaxID=980011 RepID=UPI00404AE36B